MCFANTVFMKQLAILPLEILMFKKKVFLSIVALTLICLSLTATHTSADPVDIIHIDVWSINRCGIHRNFQWSSLEWYCGYSEVRIKHYDGHEFAVEGYENELFVSWVNCGLPSYSACGYDSSYWSI